MPGLDGSFVCREVRAVSDVPVIVISGESNLVATVELLDAGADDYIRKPFRGEELLARSRAVLRRTRRSPVRGSWAIDRIRHEIRWHDGRLNLTVTEFRLLSRLVARIDEVVETRDLLGCAWPGILDPDSVWLKPHMARLRTKLIEAGAPIPVAVRGVGYRIDELEPSQTAEPAADGAATAIRQQFETEVVTEL
jgi:DNA-binding response OmpR family regulator